MICPVCNIDHGPGKKFCRKCGSALVDGAPEPVFSSTGSNTESGMVCTLCEIDYPPNAKFCKKCGTRLEEKSDADDEQVESVIDTDDVAIPEPQMTETVATETETDKTCLACGIDYTSDKKFCRKCGGRLSNKPSAADPYSVPESSVAEVEAEPVPAQSADEDKTCATCDIEYPSTAKFCRSCGGKLILKSDIAEVEKITLSAEENTSPHIQVVTSVETAFPKEKEEVEAPPVAMAAPSVVEEAAAVLEPEDYTTVDAGPVEEEPLTKEQPEPEDAAAEPSPATKPGFWGWRFAAIVSLAVIALFALGYFAVAKVRATSAAKTAVEKKETAVTPPVQQKPASAAAPAPAPMPAPEKPRPVKAVTARAKPNKAAPRQQAAVSEPVPRNTEAKEQAAPRPRKPESTGTAESRWRAREETRAPERREEASRKPVSTGIISDPLGADRR